MLPTSLRVRAKIRDMICKALHGLFLLFLWPLVLSLPVLKSCCPPHCSSSRMGQSSPGLFFAFFPPVKALCSDSHTGHSLTSLRFHHMNVCPDHTSSQWNPKPNPTWFFLSASHFLFLHNNIFLSNMLCIILISLIVALISAGTLRHNIVLWSLYWPELSEDRFKGFSEVFLLHKSRVESFLHCCSFKSHDV